VLDPPHSDDLDVAVEHFNLGFRHHYRLPTTTAEALLAERRFEAEWATVPVVRTTGVIDASCAVIARGVLSIAPRYAIGLIAPSGAVQVLAPDEGDDGSYRSGHVLLVNPLGGWDTWTAMSRWFKKHGGDNAKRMLLAGLASEDRPDDAANSALLLAAAATHGRAVALPPDEAFSSARAAEVSYIFDVPVETLRAWKKRYREGLAAKKPGRPKRNR